MVLCLIGTTHPSPRHPSHNHILAPTQACNDTIDLSTLELGVVDKPCKQIGQRIPSSNQGDLDINTLDICGLEPFPKPQQFYPIRCTTPPLPTKMPYMSYRTSGACLRCGSYDHWLADCPLPARPNPQSDTRSAGTSGKKVTIVAIDDDSNWDSSNID